MCSYRRFMDICVVENAETQLFCIQKLIGVLMRQGGDRTILYTEGVARDVTLHALGLL